MLRPDSHPLKLGPILFVFFVHSIFAAEPYQPASNDPNLENWRWTEFPFLDGRGVTCMTEEPENVYWFGGAGSIYRYDGYEVTEFGPESGYLGTVTLNLATSPDGVLYAGSDQGLFRFENDRWIAVFAAKEQGYIQVRDIDFLPDGTTLVSIGEREENTHTHRNWHGLALVQADKVKLYSNTSPSKETYFGTADNIQTITPPPGTCIQMLGKGKLNSNASLLASDGLIYVAIAENNGDNNLVVRFKHNPKNQTLEWIDSFDRDDGINIDSLSNLVESDAGEVWATSNSAVNGICRWDGSSWNHTEISEFFPGSDLFYYSLQASDGSIWIDGFGQYFVYKSGTWSKYAAPDVPLTSNSRINFFESADGAIWLIATNSKVFRLDYSSRSWSTQKGLAFQFESQNGESFYLTENGRIVKNNGDQWISYGPEDGIIDTPLKLYQTSYGENWAIGSHNGEAALSYLDPSENWNIVEFPQLSWGFDHRVAYEDKDDRLYFAATVDAKSHQNPGVIRYNNPSQDKSDWTHIHQNPKIVTKGSFYGIGQDTHERIWVGGRPPAIIEDNTFKTTKEFQGLSTYVDHIFNQPGGDLWLITRDQGILQISSKGDFWHTIDTGLPSHSVISGFAQNDKEVWVALSDQISHFDGTSWSSFMALPAANYSQASISLQSGSEKELHITQVSKQWIRRTLHNEPLIADSAPFQTLTFRNDDNAPKIEITHFEPNVSEIGNTSITWQAIDYLETTPREKIEYSYKLNDQAWTPFANKDHQLFLGLPHGMHSLQVRARDHSFNVSPKIAAVSFTVAAPVWRQLWFQATLFTLIALVVVLWIITIKRNTRLAHLNDDLSQANQQLQNQQQMIESQNETLLKHKQHLEEHVKERTKDLEIAKSRAEESDRLKSAFLANVSHEIRTPMNAIIGFSELLMYSEWENEEDRGFMETIQNSGKDLLNLIDDIIEVSKIETEKLEFELEPVSVDWILNQTQETFRGVLTRFGKEDLQFLVNKEKLPHNCILDTDANRLKQILKNLISNAIKFTPDGYIQLSCQPNEAGDALEFSVEDSGFGIKEDQLSVIFERFQKADTNTGHTYRGSGLGLSISQNLATKLGGEIKVQSELEKGSRFYFSLPWAGKSRPEADLPNAKTSQTQILNPQNPVLVVEDEDANFTLISSMLKRLNVEYVHAANGERAVALCKQKSFSAVLMDIKLPTIQGDEAAKQIREIAPNLPIIAQTAYAMTDEQIRYSKEPFVAYLSKPLSLASLSETLSQAIA